MTARQKLISSIFRFLITLPYRIIAIFALQIYKDILLRYTIFDTSYVIVMVMVRKPQCKNVNKS